LEDHIVTVRELNRPSQASRIDRETERLLGKIVEGTASAKDVATYRELGADRLGTLNIKRKMASTRRRKMKLRLLKSAKSG
jgi:hypothetical protein